MSERGEFSHYLIKLSLKFSWWYRYNDFDNNKGITTRCIICRAGHERTSTINSNRTKRILFSARGKKLKIKDLEVIPVDTMK